MLVPNKIRVYEIPLLKFYVAWGNVFYVLFTASFCVLPIMSRIILAWKREGGEGEEQRAKDQRRTRGGRQ